MQKTLTLLFAFAIFVLVVGLQTDIYADHKPKHNPGGGGGDGEPTIRECPNPGGVDSLVTCIADVGKTFTSNTPASEYADNYVKIESNEFDRILQALMEGTAADELCAAYDVLVFNWNSPRIKNLNWQRLLDYMDCGGGIVFEDQRNVLGLAPGVSIIEATRTSPDDEPITVRFGTVPPVPAVLISGSTGTTPPPMGFGSTATFRNKHIIFGTSAGLTPFLRLESPHPNAGEVVGLFGVFGAGRIVLTGIDNNFHGREFPTHEDPDMNVAIKNSYDLLFNEIDWLLAPP